MGTSIFLGMPPENIKNWIIEHGPEPSDVPDPVDTTEWGQVVAALENCTSGQFDSSTLAYTGSDSLLTAFNLGSGVSDLKYNIYSSSDPVDTTWINLGFNATVPEYVKYRRAIDGGWKHVWLKSLKSGLLAPIAIGDKVCLRDYNESTYDNDYYETAEVVTAVAGSFNYGNNATFSVPTSITTAKGTYDFCGYNFCLNSQPVLSVEGCISCIWSGDPDTYTGTNDWSQATLRKWLNTAGTVDGMRFYDTDT